MLSLSLSIGNCRLSPDLLFVALSFFAILLKFTRSNKAAYVFIQEIEPINTHFVQLEHYVNNLQCVSIIDMVL